VAPNKDYKDRVTGQNIAKVTTGQIYWGSVPFVLIQIIMVGLIIAFPNLVSGGLDKKAEINTDNVQIEFQANEDKKIDDDPMAAFKDLPKDSDKK
jgi:GntP family gluconate:H+ symporter